MVMYRGRIVAHLDAAKCPISESAIMNAALGNADKPPTQARAVDEIGAS